MNINFMKTTFTIFFFVFSMIGFMVRLPSIFHNYDKLLHALFYFAAAITLNLIYPKKWFLIVVILFLFGISIEGFQAVSNKIIVKKIHGNFDIQDVIYNTIGLVIGTICFYTLHFLIQNFGIKKIKNNKSFGIL
jgi:VanZ family protein